MAIIGSSTSRLINSDHPHISDVTISQVQKTMVQGNIINGSDVTYYKA